MIVEMATAVCDGCSAEQLTGPRRGWFASRGEALGAALAAGWVRRLSGRLLCPRCSDAAQCEAFGHDYGPDPVWRVCACEGSLYEHSGHEPWQGPSAWDGCGWMWRLCGRCDHIDERHVTARPLGLPTAAERAYDAALSRAPYRVPEDQPGGHIRQDTPAGPALPNNHKATEETAMVEPTPTPSNTSGGAR
ncbi:hypothetical protein [Pseudonocardia sp. N23]|uniref:hypothetical protein n=1 Tax=Pseudonocardia sp. N23 TaxID=1987376 RepID=UPI000BFC999D|nr:hypothetical protein [Pseudonocardia sp. N23]GAY12440.1 hypothetical protein TOK_0836 [Pseudonocardia sp. N23]